MSYQLKKSRKVRIILFDLGVHATSASCFWPSLHVEVRPLLEGHGHGADGDGGEGEGVPAPGLGGGGDLPCQELLHRPVDPGDEVAQGQEEDDDAQDVHFLRRSDREPSLTVHLNRFGHCMVYERV